MTKYAITINEDNLDLIEALNSGVRPIVEEDTFFIVTLPDPANEHHSQILRGDDLYDGEGISKIDVVFL